MSAADRLPDQPPSPQRWRQWLSQWDDGLASAALLLMMLVSLVEMAMRPLMGQGVENASILVQHLGLVLAMFGALAAERHGHLSTLGGVGQAAAGGADGAAGRIRRLVQAFGNALAALVCGALALASWRFVATEMETAHKLAYGMPVWWVQAAMPLGFAVLGLKLGGLALALFWQDGLPLASVALSHYQITVNPSLPALPLFTLAGLVFARTGAAQRIGAAFTGRKRYFPLG